MVLVPAAFAASRLNAGIPRGRAGDIMRQSALDHFLQLLQRRHFHDPPRRFGRNDHLFTGLRIPAHPLWRLLLDADRDFQQARQREDSGAFLSERVLNQRFELLENCDAEDFFVAGDERLQSVDGRNSPSRSSASRLDGRNDCLGFFRSKSRSCVIRHVAADAWNL